MGIAVLFFLFSHFSFASDPAWLALLHSDGHSSSVKAGSSFFLSPLGHVDSEAELLATKEYFARNPEAACRFPARAIYLGTMEEKNTPLCERWQKWRDAINATGAELVFAAAFLSSPSSMYGHTLLKFVRGGKTAGEDLLDYTLNYGAKTGDVIGLPYVWKGLSGGFDGSYTVAPFYLKVKEYNHIENRDFWIYPLKLSPEQLRLLAAHAWELRDVDFPYFFLRRNCSFYLLELLEVLKPGSRLTSHFPFWTVPVDTIRLLTNEGWLAPARYRSSRYRRLKELRFKLSEEERKTVEAIADTGNAPMLSMGREPLILDASYELWRYRSEGKTSAPAVEAKLLAQRSRFSQALSLDFSQERPPDMGHPSSRIGLGSGKNRTHQFAELQYRGTLHDLLADPHGYENHSELSMGDIRLRAEAKKIFLERADILRLRSVAPSERWIPRSAWAFRAGVGRAKEFACIAMECFRGGLDGGYGGALMIGPLLAFALIEMKLEAGSVFDRGWRWGGGPSGGLFSPLWHGGRFLLEGEWRWRLLGSHMPERSARAGLSQELGRLWELRLQGELLRGYREGSAAIFYYF